VQDIINPFIQKALDEYQYKTINEEQNIGKNIIRSI